MPSTLWWRANHEKSSNLTLTKPNTKILNQSVVYAPLLLENWGQRNGDTLRNNTGKFQQNWTKSWKKNNGECSTLQIILKISSLNKFQIWLTLWGRLVTFIFWLFDLLASKLPSSHKWHAQHFPGFWFSTAFRSQEGQTRDRQTDRQTTYNA